jgi:hypothetical protein
MILASRQCSLLEKGYDQHGQLIIEINQYAIIIPDYSVNQNATIDQRTCPDLYSYSFSLNLSPVSQKDELLITEMV